MRGEPRPAKTATIEPRILFLPPPPPHLLSLSLSASLSLSHHLIIIFWGGCLCPSLWFAPASVAAHASARSQKSSACLCGSEDHRRVHSCCSEQPETTNLCVSSFTLTETICLTPSATSRCVRVSLDFVDKCHCVVIPVQPGMCDFGGGHRALGGGALTLAVFRV